jgi:putative flippase GtrA
MLSLRKDNLHPTIKYALVGTSGYLVFVALLTIQIEFFKIEPVLASLLAFIPVFLVSYAVSYGWVFQSNDRHRNTFIRYSVTTAIGLSLNLLIMYFTIYHLEWQYIYSQLGVFFIVGTNNYLINRYWAFS